MRKKNLALLKKKQKSSEEAGPNTRRKLNSPEPSEKAVNNNKYDSGSNENGDDSSVKTDPEYDPGPYATQAY